MAAVTEVASLRESLNKVRESFDFDRAEVVHNAAEPRIALLCCDPLCWGCWGCCNCVGDSKGGGEAIAVVLIALIALAGFAVTGAYTAAQANQAAIMQKARQEIENTDKTHFSTEAQQALEQLNKVLGQQLAARVTTTVAGCGAIVAIAFLMAAAIAAIISLKRPVTFNYTGTAILGGQIMAAAVGLALLAHFYAYLKKPTEARFDRWVDQLAKPVAGA